MIDSGPTASELGINVETETASSRIGIQQLRDEQENNVFHQRVADRYNDWRRSLFEQDKDFRKEIFRPDTYSGDWTKIDPADYILHRLTVISITDSTEVTAEQVGRVLDDYREKIAIPDRISLVQKAYRDFNVMAMQFGLSAGNFDPNRLVFVRGERIVDLAGENMDGLAYTLKGSVGEIIIPYDDADLNKDPNQMYDVIVHELGHQARIQKGLDKDKSTCLDEGIIQVQARQIETTNDRTSRRTDEVYHIEAQVAQQLATALGTESLFGMSHQEIRNRMNEKYMVSGMVEEPYDDLAGDLLRYRNKFDSFAGRIKPEEPISDTEITAMQTELKHDRQWMNQKWGFKLN